MALFPNTKSGKIAFFNSVLAPWGTNASAIGLSSSSVTALTTLVTSAQDKYADQVSAENAVKLATQTADVSVDAMVAAGMEMVKSIRAKAANSTDPQAIYQLAQIPAPATPSPVTELGMAHDFKVELGMDGAVTLKWKCTNPRASGVVYQIWRKLDGETEFSFLGVTGEKKITDPTVPAGSQSTAYKIQAVRSTATGPVATVTVLFGVAASGAMTASVVAQPKLAA